MNIITIGVYLTDNKKEGIVWPSLVRLCEEYNSKNIIHGNCVELVDVTEDNYLTLKPHKIISKFDEFYTEKKVNEKIITHLSSLPCLMDPLINQINVGNRSVMADKLKQVCLNYDKLFVPDYAYVTKLNYCPELKFPIICKPNIAFGYTETHSMCIVKDYDALLEASVTLPLLLQTFHEHDSIIYKVYVIKNHINVCIKNSISFKDKEKSIVYFNTEDLKKTPNNLTNDQVKLLLDTLNESIDLIKLTEELSKTFGLTLFGYDMIKVNGSYAIIDINYFPGYKGCPNFQEHLLEYFVE
jgi:hypothetical protein